MSRAEILTVLVIAVNVLSIMLNLAVAAKLRKEVLKARRIKQLVIKELAE